MPGTLVAHTAKDLGTNGGTTSAIDTTGADFLVIVLSWFGTDTSSPTDSKGNTWHPLTQQNQDNYNSRMFWCKPTTVGSGHTFSYSVANTYSEIAVQAWSGSAASPFDKEITGAKSNSGVTTLSLSAVTPSQANSLLISGVMWQGTTTSPSINSSFVLGDWISGNPDCGVGIASLQQGAAASVTGAWSWTGGGVRSAVVGAVFKLSASGRVFYPASLDGIGGAGPKQFYREG